jgi:hypothetical protein
VLQRCTTCPKRFHFVSLTDYYVPCATVIRSIWSALLLSTFFPPDGSWLFTCIYVRKNINWNQWYINPGCQVALATKLYIVTPNICRSTAQDMLHVTILTTRIFRWHLDFCTICAPLTSTIFKDSVRTAQWTISISVVKNIQLMLYREIISVCSQIHTKHINTLCGQNVELYIKTQSVPRTKHTPSQL